MKSLTTIIFIQNLSKECKLLYLLIKIKKEKAKKKERKMATYVRRLINFIIIIFLITI